MSIPGYTIRTCPHARGTPNQEDTELLQGGEETILVVDDDPLQRRALQSGLNRLGYATTVVASGEEALAYLAEHEVDLLVLDMVMPAGMDGAETYERVLRIRPAQKAIVMSGLADTQRVADALAMGAGECLRKPVTLDKLAKAVRDELDKNNSPRGRGT